MAKQKYDYAKNNQLKDEIAKYTTDKMKEIAANLNNEDGAALKELNQYFKQFATFHNYSARNVVIMSEQAQTRGMNLSKVQSFKDWGNLKNDTGDSVRINKGSNGLKIFIPQEKIVYKRDSKGEFLLDAADKRIPELNENGKPKKTTYFTLGTVFDIAQTNALEIGAIKKSHVYLNAKENSLNISDNFVNEMIGKVKKEFDLTIKTELIPNLSSGYNRKTEAESIIVLDETLKPEQKLSVLFHELGHHIMHKYGNKFSKEQKEAEAESFAHVLSSKFGIDNNSSAYIKGYVKDENELMKLLSNVQRAVSQAHKKLNLDESLEKALLTAGIGLNDEQTIKPNERKTFISDDDAAILFKKTKDELYITDPIDVLNDLNIDYKIKRNGTQYIFAVRKEENTPSASLYIARDGNWKFHDFGSGESGTIENVVMQLDNKSFKEANEYVISKLGVTDYFQEELAARKNIDYKPQQVEVSEVGRKNIEELKESNKERASKFNNNTKIISIKEIDINNTQAMEFLKSRGITKIPSFIYEAEGEIFGNKNGRDYSIKNKGLGVATTSIEPLENDKLGIDIHYYKKVELADRTIKSATYGANGITVFENGTAEKLVIAESKWDMASANEKDMLKDATCIIANSTGNIRLIEDYLKDKSFTNTLILNQNDKAGDIFKDAIIESAALKTNTIYTMKYAADEIKQDVNDLLMNDIDLRSRITKVVNINEFSNKYGLDEKQSNALSEIVKDKTPGNAMQDIKSEMLFKIDENIPSARDIVQDKKDLFEELFVKQVSKGNVTYNYWIDKDDKLVYNKDDDLSKKLTMNELLHSRSEITNKTDLSMQDIKQVDNKIYDVINNVIKKEDVGLHQINISTSRKKNQ